MPNSKRTFTGSWRRSSALLFALVFLFLIANQSFAEVPLDKLSNCNAIREVFASLEKPISKNDCRDAESSLERIVRDSVVDQTEFCFVTQVPSAALRGFSCEQSRSDRGEEVTCFRETSLSDIDEFKVNHEDHELRQSQYLTKAASCAKPEADLSPASESLFPGFLQLISTPEFAFVATWPPSGEYQKTVVHGFSKVNRIDLLSHPEAIEYLSAWTSTKSNDNEGQKQRIGPWTITIDEMDEFESAQNDLIEKAIAKLPASLRRQNRLSLDWIKFQIERKRGLRATLQYKKNVTEEILQSIADELVNEGLELADTDEIEKITGQNADQLLERAIEKIPPGLRSIGSLKFMVPVRILLNEHLATCSLDSSGAIGAMVLGIEPRPGIQSNYGDASLLFFRMGRCARGQATDRYVKSLQAQVREIIAGQLSKVE